MFHIRRIQKIFLFGVFTSYMLFLGKLLFFSRITQPTHSAVNLLPFRTIIEWLFSDTDSTKKFAFGNIIGNIAIFIPLGIYTQLYKNILRFTQPLFLLFAVSIAIEVAQGIFDIGTVDIDDVLLNFLGGWVGIIVYKTGMLILSDEQKVCNVITAFSIIGLPILLFFLFMMRMQF